MGNKLRVVGIKPPDSKWKNMKAVLDACRNAGVEAPAEVWEFFDDVEPDEAGVIVDLQIIVTPWQGQDAQGYEVKINSIPKDVKVIRFYNSW